MVYTLVYMHRYVTIVKHTTIYLIRSISTGAVISSSNDLYTRSVSINDVITYQNCMIAKLTLHDLAILTWDWISIQSGFESVQF